MKSKAATQAELAEALGVTDRTVRHYLARGMPGSDAKGRFAIAKCRDWVDANIRERGEVQSADLHEALKRAELAKTEEQAKKLKIANDINEGLLVYRDDVVQEVNEMVLRVKTRLESFPNEVEMQLPVEIRAAVKAELEERVYLVLKEMSEFTIGDKKE